MPGYWIPNPMITFIREWRPDTGTRWWAIKDVARAHNGLILGVYEDLESAVIYAYGFGVPAPSKPVLPNPKRNRKRI